ncbi:HupE/UreJ family protein [Pseudosulfitobacter koreensis]|uniref:HupE/UreJ family protein n=1 Tax=Pseudosulfitobacter koreensis TaxID=2968472 RepID=A0ABT1Z268_9RHOB|nr:HupE/UreJ family protein [Pseudosulfitobacter koreense]MCR8827213.1 HupE/UreJ family protein [Pseudosulfitobacter koreense]
MTKPFAKLASKLRQVAAMSTLWLLTVASSGHAHEIMPTVADISNEGSTLTLQLRANVEAFLAGIDMDAITDTDTAAQAEDYDALRARPVEEIEGLLDGLIADWNAVPMVRSDGAAVPLSLFDFQVAEAPDPQAPRQSLLTMTGQLPAGASEVTVFWPDGQGALVLRQQGVDEPFTGYIESGSDSGPIALAGGDVASGWTTFAGYIPVGFDHILPKGLNHILFVLGLFLLSTAWRPLIVQISVFTVAHTVTLALGALGLVSVPGSIVEPLIAASIVYVAVENIFWRRLSPWRPFVIFGFGLLHGLGFASVLGEFGLPADQFVPALLGFNVGVEIGQLTVVALAAILFVLALSAARAVRLEGDEIFVQESDVLFRAVSITGSLIIALIGAWWVVERVFL